MLAMYLTVWVGVVLFAAADAARSWRPTAQAPRWAWWAFASGLLLAIVHTMLAFAIVHQWSHADAVRSTAVQTQAVYGVAFGGGVYVNYVFFTVWLADAWWWRLRPPHSRPGWATWTLRAFYVVILINAAGVFVPGWRGRFGMALVAALASVWIAGAVRTSVASARAHPRER